MLIRAFRSAKLDHLIGHCIVGGNIMNKKDAKMWECYNVEALETTQRVSRATGNYKLRFHLSASSIWNIYLIDTVELGTHIRFTHEIIYV